MTRWFSITVIVCLLITTFIGVVAPMSADAASWTTDPGTDKWYIYVKFTTNSEAFAENDRYEDDALAGQVHYHGPYSSREECESAIVKRNVYEEQWCTKGEGAYKGTYTFMAPLPGISPGARLTSYLETIFNLVIGLILVLAIIMLTVAGIRYMTAGDSEDQVKSAKQQIQGAVGGILLAAASWLILYTINPEILNMDVTADLGTSTSTDESFELQNPGDIPPLTIGESKEIVFPVTGVDSSDNPSADCSLRDPIPDGMEMEYSADRIRIHGSPTADNIPGLNDEIAGKQLYTTLNIRCGYEKDAGSGRGQTETVQLVIDIMTDEEYETSRNWGHVAGGNQLNPLLSDEALGDAVRASVGDFSNAHYMELFWDAGLDHYYYYGPYKTAAACQEAANEIIRTYVPETGPQAGSRCYVDMSNDNIQQLFNRIDGINEHEDLCSDAWYSWDATLRFQQCDRKEAFADSWE